MPTKSGWRILILCFSLWSKEHMRWEILPVHSWCTLEFGMWRVTGIESLHSSDSTSSEKSLFSFWGWMKFLMNTLESSASDNIYKQMIQSKCKWRIFRRQFLWRGRGYSLVREHQTKETRCQFYNQKSVGIVVEMVDENVTEKLETMALPVIPKETLHRRMLTWEKSFPIVNSSIMKV